MKKQTDRKRPNWKFGTLMATIIVLLGVVLFSFFSYETEIWLISIIFPMILSAVASIGVSLWFTIKTEKEALYRELVIERDGLFQYGVSADEQYRQHYGLLLIFPSIKATDDDEQHSCNAKHVPDFPLISRAACFL